MYKAKNDGLAVENNFYVISWINIDNISSIHCRMKKSFIQEFYFQTWLLNSTHANIFSIYIESWYDKPDCPCVLRECVFDSSTFWYAWIYGSRFKAIVKHLNSILLTFQGIAMSSRQFARTQYNFTQESSTQSEKRRHFVTVMIMERQVLTAHSKWLAPGSLVRARWIWWRLI